MKGTPFRLGHARSAGALAAGAALAMIGVWGFAIEPAGLQNEDHDIALERWPAACDGTRVAVLADLHVGSPWNDTEKLERIIDLTLAAEPDLVLLAGDYVIHGVVGGRFEAPEEIARRLARLRAPLGVFAVLGNHDWWLGGARVRAALEQSGIPVLENASTQVGSGACRFWLTGIADYWEGGPDPEAALAPVPHHAPVLAFTHNPDLFPLLPADIALTIAGHTHGGQVDLLVIGRPVVPSQFGQRYAAGHVVEDGRHLFVSTGLGTSILPVRFRVPPEVSVVTLRALPGSTGRDEPRSAL